MVVWKKPARPKWMTRELHAELPGTLTLRELRVAVKQRGFRTKILIVVTTLLRPADFSAEDIAQLYRARWNAELNLRSIKIVLQMDHLRCKTPHRVRNEIWMHLVAYNGVCCAMATAAHHSKRQPWQISFKGTVQTLNQFLPQLGSVNTVAAYCEALISCIATHIVGNRPDRVEPRVKKRRQKKFKYMTKPRAEYKRGIV